MITSRISWVTARRGVATTILRTTQVLGYKSFAEFAAALRQHFVARITPYTVLKAATREKRIAQAVEWMAEGKKRNWKYEKC